MKVRILHVISSGFVGGPEKQILHHAKDMADSRYHVELASFHDDVAPPEILSAAARLGIRSTCFPGGIRLSALTALIDELRDRKFDLLCTHGYKANILGHLATRKQDKPAHIAFVRGWTAETWRVALYERLAKHALRTVPTVVCVSRKQAEQLAPQRRQASLPIVVPNAILPPYDGSLRSFKVSGPYPRIPAGAFVFGSVGRLSIEKGHRYLLDAFAQLCSATPERSSFLILLGEGRERAALEAQAQRLAIAKRVFFAGFQRDCSSWMQRLHCLVQPSLTEGTPNSVLEALHYRLPVVATAVGGIPDLIADQQNGLLVAERNPHALAEAMKTVLLSDELRQRFAARADQVMQQYSPQVQRERLISVYDHALKLTHSSKAFPEAQPNAA